jgi:hypothetical protein
LRGGPLIERLLYIHIDTNVAKVVVAKVM